MSKMPEQGIVLTDEQKRRRRARSLAIALSLGALVLLVYLVTIVKLGPGVMNRPSSLTTRVRAVRCRGWGSKASHAAQGRRAAETSVRSENSARAASAGTGS